MTIKNIKDQNFSWINYFLSKEENSFFCRIDQTYIHDNFNLYGLNKQVSYFEHALDLICGIDDEEDYSQNHQELIKKDANTLFGLLHARFILTNQGMQIMLEKYRNQDFGNCTNVYCENISMLPCGLTDEKNKDNVKLYCPSCENVFNLKNSKERNIDGAYFGTSFPHLFFFNFPELKPDNHFKKYIPKIFGFKVNEEAYLHSLEQKKV